ncbi:sentrin-specific protease-like [Anopheles bellator]|uniref:sentrin-specific protease-like n=1 Tax=Anopheles bellator TaxID=139047 RepID=UPI0026478221|nr:sentrin-specific protease-like [Anopheles bellator]
MFSGGLLSRLKQIITGCDDGHDRKRKSAVQFNSIDPKRARMTHLPSIPAPVENDWHCAPVVDMHQNGHRSTIANPTAMSKGARFMVDLTDDDSQPVANDDGLSIRKPLLNARRSMGSRPFEDHTGTLPKPRAKSDLPMLIPLKCVASNPVPKPQIRELGTRFGRRSLSNQTPPSINPITGLTTKTTSSIPELTGEFHNLLRTKYSMTPWESGHRRSSNGPVGFERDTDSEYETLKRYEMLMKKFIPNVNDSTDTTTSAKRGQYSSFVLNGPLQRPPLHQQQKSPEVGAIVDLTDDEDDTCSYGSAENGEPVLEGSRKATSGRLFDTTDQPTIARPSLEKVNTFKEKLQTKPAYRENIIQDVQQRYGSLFDQRKSLIEQEKQRLNDLNKNTLEQENLMRSKMLNYVSTFRAFELMAIDEQEPKEATPEPEEVPLPALTQAQLDLINRKLRAGGEVVADKFNLKIKGKDLVTLAGSNWLNDEVINFYMELLRERSVVRSELPKVYTMNTFFLPRLMQNGYSGVRRWTRKVDIFAHDILVVPVHVNGVHWCMSIVDLRRKTIHYYDSMGSPNNPVLNALESYLCEESQDKRKTPFDKADLTKQNIRDCPRQQNGSDCGVFSCMFAEFLTRDRPITFGQTDMQYFRQKMMVEIVQGQLLT